MRIKLLLIVTVSFFLFTRCGIVDYFSTPEDSATEELVFEPETGSPLEGWWGPDSTVAREEPQPAQEEEVACESKALEESAEPVAQEVAEVAPQPVRLESLFNTEKHSGPQPRVLLFSERAYTHVRWSYLKGGATAKAYVGGALKAEKSIDAGALQLVTVSGGRLMWSGMALDSVVFEGESNFRLGVQRKGTWEREERMYRGRLLLRRSGAGVQAILKLPQAAYLAGVVEAEGGTSDQIAYLKVQAVLARTWLQSNWKKHIAEGFNVKDDQSSQAFKGIARLKNAALIAAAVSQTGDTVVVDAKGKPIVAFYHSNSGGQTALPEEVWSSSLAYCQSVQDTFSCTESKAVWTAELPLDKWNAHFHKYGIRYSEAQWSAFAKNLPEERLGYWTFENGKRVKLSRVRTAFRLRSAWFTPRFASGKVYLDGKGFGHGVGLSQQGAMRMAELGYSWQDIVHHYFANVHLLARS